LFFYIGGILDHHCLEVIICFVDIGGIVDHHCLDVIACFVYIGGIVDHHCLEVIVCFLKANNHLPTMMVNNSTNINKTNNQL
jgi:hypothetical protein